MNISNKIRYRKESECSWKDISRIQRVEDSKLMEMCGECNGYNYKCAFYINREEKK